MSKIKPSKRVTKLPKSKTSKTIAKKPKQASAKPLKKGLRSTGFEIDYIVKTGKNGQAIFADQNIKKGQLVWKYMRGINVKAFKNEKETRAYLATKKTSLECRFWLEHAYHTGGFLNNVLGHRQPFNHSE